VDRFLGREEDREGVPDGEPSGRILTENAIKRDLLGRIDRLAEGDLAEIALFYFADHRLRGALAEAIGRGAVVRLLLDSNKDAFGRKKNGIPNRQTGLWLAERGAEVRWYRTSGEQFHAKMALFRYGDGRAALSLGSANWTRRNLDNLNLETNVVLAGPAEEEVFRRAGDFFSLLWSNAFGRGADGVPADLVTSLPFAEYKDPSRLRKILAWLMERTGAGTF
jgi:phosphatidylserine/phosphatidylglycerophosphate/cardiolipin synthase-like enzyme